MNTALWVAQGILVFVFLYSGFSKSTQSERTLVAWGQTGVEGLPLALIRFIGITELLAVVALLLPAWSNDFPLLTPLAATGLAVIMALAARVHYRRNERKTVWLNLGVLALCLLVTVGRLVKT